MTADEKTETPKQQIDQDLAMMETTEIARRLGFLQGERVNLEATIKTCQGALQSLDDRIGLHLARLVELKDNLPKKDLKDIPSTPQAQMKAKAESVVMPCPVCVDGDHPVNMTSEEGGRRTCPECSTPFADGDAVREAWARREVAEMAAREDNNGEDEMKGEPAEGGVKCPGIEIEPGKFSGCTAPEGGEDCPVCEGKGFLLIEDMD